MLPDLAQWTATKSCHKLVFCVFPERLLSNIIFRWLHCYGVTLVKKYKKPLLQKCETKNFKQKRFHKKLVQSQREKILERLEIKSDNVPIANNKQMFAVKLPANSVVASNCYIGHVWTRFHIWLTTSGII